LVDPRVGGIGGDDPEAFDFTTFDAVDNLVISPRRFGGDAVFGNVEDVGDFLAMFGIGEVVAAEEGGGVGKEAAAHGVALAGDGVGAVAGLADVSGEEGEVDDGLGGADALVRLVHAHCPPEGDAFTFLGDFVGEGFDFRSSEACFVGYFFRGVVF